MSIDSWAALQPHDEHNRKLAENVHPTDWINPKPKGRYNLVVIGAGTAGLVAAAGAAGLGAKVALIERHLMGGDCLNVGCVPSKAIIAAARTAAAARNAAAFGIHTGPVDVDFAKVMQRMRSLRADISPHDSAARFRDLGVDVFLGDAAFITNGQIRVKDQVLTYKKAVIATGARAAKPSIPGIDDVSPLTNETLFSLTTLPRRMTVIGGGPIGCEMAQAFARLGSSVTQIEKADRILSREDADAALVVREAMRRDGVQWIHNARVVRFERRGNDKTTIYQIDGVESEVRADEILLSIGRTPNVDDMGLETVGVEYDRRTGVSVNDRLQTTNPSIYAAGDVASKYKFTHAADFMARLVIGNSLFLGRGKFSGLMIPWSTYTSPELARVGMTAETGGGGRHRDRHLHATVLRGRPQHPRGSDRGFCQSPCCQRVRPNLGRNHRWRNGRGLDWRNDAGDDSRHRTETDRLDHPPLPHPSRRDSQARRSVQQDTTDAQSGFGHETLVGVDALS